MPGCTACRSRATARTLVPFIATSTSSPGRIPRRSASSADSSACWRGARNLSAGAWRVSRPAQSVRTVPSFIPSGSSGGDSSGASGMSGAVERGRRVALLPAHAAAADLLEREPGVERARPPPPAAVTIGVVARVHRRAEPGAELGQHERRLAHLAGVADRLAESLNAAVRVGHRAFLLGVGRRREDDVRALDPGRHVVGEGDHESGAVERLLPRAPARVGLERVGVEQDERAQLTAERVR